MEFHRCALCLFCEDLSGDHVRCSNADVALDSGWEEVYTTQGYLDLSTASPEREPCFWFVQKR